MIVCMGFRHSIRRSERTMITPDTVTEAGNGIVTSEADLGGRTIPAADDVRQVSNVVLPRVSREVMDLC